MRFYRQDFSLCQIKPTRINELSKVELNGSKVKWLHKIEIGHRRERGMQFDRIIHKFDGMGDNNNNNNEIPGFSLFLTSFRRNMNQWTMAKGP